MNGNKLVFTFGPAGPTFNASQTSGFNAALRRQAAIHDLTVDTPASYHSFTMYGLDSDTGEKISHL